MPKAYSDKERLDWLTKRQTSLEFMDWRKSTPWVMGHLSTEWAKSNPRQAIDAAMTQERRTDRAKR